MSTRNSRGTISFPPQIHANHEILHCRLEECLLCWSISKERQHFPWNLKGSLMCFTKLQQFPQIPVPTREECYVSRHKSRRALFSPPQVKIRVDCPASPGKECRTPGQNSRGGWYLHDTGGEPGGLVTIRKPRISTSTPDQA